LFLVMFFLSVIHKKTWETSWRLKSTILFVVVNATLLILFSISLFFGVRTLKLQPLNAPRVPPWVNAVRKVFSASVFFILMAILAGCGHRVRRLMIKPKTQIPQLQGISVAKMTTVLALLVSIFISRSIVDLVCIMTNECAFTIAGYKVHLPTFGKLMDNWVEDMITCVLFFIWEITPLIIVLLLFYRIPSTGKSAVKTENATSLEYSQYFRPPNQTTPLEQDLLDQSAKVFKNPKRYDSDEEVSTLIEPSSTDSNLNYGSFGYVPYSTSSSLNND